MNKIYLILSCVFVLTAMSCSTSKVAKDTMKDSKGAQDLAWRSAAPAAGPAPKIQLGKFEKFTLDNGLQVVVVENHKLPTVSFQVQIDRQPLLEGDKAGYTSMAGTLMMHGTTNRSKDEIDLAVDYIGANLGTSASSISGSCLTKHKDALLEIMADVLYNPAFPQEEFDKVKNQTISGLQTQKNDANAIASNVRQVINYGKDHEYGEIVTEETVENITVEDCKKYYQNYWKPNISYLAIVGDITPADAKKLAAKYFGDWKKGDVKKKEISVPPMPEKNRVCFVDKAGAVQSVVNVTYPVEYKPNDPDRIPASVMMNILGGGVFSGYLMQNLREDKAYTYGARASMGTDRYISNFNAYASVRNEVTDSSITEFLYEINRLKTEDVDADHLQLVKNSMSGQFARSLENAGSLAQRIINIERYDLPEDFYEKYLENVNAVSVADVNRVAQRFLKPDAANIVVVGNKDDVADKLTKFAASGEVEFFDYYGNPIEDVGMTVPEGLTGKDVIGDYIDAIGGADKLKSVEDLTWMVSMSLMGQTLEADLFKKQGGKMVFEMKMQGQVMQKQLLNGDKGYQEQMGAGKTPLEGDELLNAQQEAQLFKEMSYLTDDYKIEITGIEVIDGRPAYKLKIDGPTGANLTEYYDIETNYKIREITSSEGQGGQMVSIQNDYQDYKEVDGIMFAHTIVLSGAMPVPITQETKEIKLNTGLDDSIFSVD